MKQQDKPKADFGLRIDEIETITSVLARHKKVACALIYGSRAKGTYRRGSDVDLALKGEDLDHRTIAAIHDWLNEETLMPYHFDVLNYHVLDNPNLVAHIDRVGKIIYSDN